MGVHNGHRERLKNRFIEHGLVNFNELNALELLLFYAIPRKDTNELAHALLDRFETLSGVFEASFQELTEVPGIGENAATLILLIPQIIRKCFETKDGNVEFITNSEAAGRYFVPRSKTTCSDLKQLPSLSSIKPKFFISRTVLTQPQTLMLLPPNEAGSANMPEIF